MRTLIDYAVRAVYKCIDKKIAKLRNNQLVGTFDVPDKRDFIDGEPKSITLPDKVDLYAKGREIFANQTGDTLELPEQSHNSCSAYAVGDCKIITNLLHRGQVITFNQELQWSHQEDEAGATRNGGGTLQGALKMLLKYPQGFPIKEYRRITGGLEHLKKRLALGMPIYTGISWKVNPDGGSNYSDMKNTGIWNWFKTKLLGGHAILIVGYDNQTKMFKCIEPLRYIWGANRAMVFYIPYDQIFNTMSQYVLYDNID